MLLTRLAKSLCVVPVRRESIWKNYRKQQALANWEGGIKYKGFTYYPKPGEVDVPYEPSKLFMVQRIGKWRGSEYWCKQILFDFKLDKFYSKGKVVVIKNTPVNCAKLWKVKHLVKITPITFPHGEPKEEDVLSTFLNHKGELEIKKNINDDDVKEIVESKPNPLSLKKQDLKRQSLQEWTKSWKSLFDN